MYFLAFTEKNCVMENLIFKDQVCHSNNYSQFPPW